NRASTKTRLGSDAAGRRWEAARASMANPGAARAARLKPPPRCAVGSNGPSPGGETPRLVTLGQSAAASAALSLVRLRNGPAGSFRGGSTLFVDHGPRRGLWS